MSKQLNDLFDYDYKIYQDTDYFKFSLDSILLAEFVDLKMNQKSILDFCAGNGAVSMILHKIYGDKINITAIELQKEIYDLAIESLKYNNISDINFINDDIKNYINTKNYFDVVVCNPPYFEFNNNININDNKVKAIARHEIDINLEEVIMCASKVTKNKGYFYLVHRPERVADIITLLNKYNFGVKKLQFVYDHVGAKCSLVIIESMYNGENCVKVKEPFYLNNRNSYKRVFKGD